MSISVQICKQLRAAERTFRLNISFTSASNRIVLHGPSGSGKSLTMKAIAGLMTPDSGKVVLNERTLFNHESHTNLRPQERNVAYLFQDYALFPHLNVAQNIAFGLRRGCFNLRRPASHPAVQRWLQAFELEATAHSYPAQISGGQRQRVALARALVSEPDILLLDEPFAALDPSLRTHMRRELDDLQQQTGVPMLIITHDPADVEAFGEAVYEVRDGTIRQQQ